MVNTCEKFKVDCSWLIISFQGRLNAMFDVLKQHMPKEVKLFKPQVSKYSPSL